MNDILPAVGQIDDNSRKCLIYCQNEYHKVDFLNNESGTPDFTFIQHGEIRPVCSECRDAFVIPKNVWDLRTVTWEKVLEQNNMLLTKNRTYDYLKCLCYVCGKENNNNTKQATEYGDASIVPYRFEFKCRSGDCPERSKKVTICSPVLNLGYSNGSKKCEICNSTVDGVIFQWSCKHQICKTCFLTFYKRLMTNNAFVKPKESHPFRNIPCPNTLFSFDKDATNCKDVILLNYYSLKIFGNDFYKSHIEYSNLENRPKNFVKCPDPMCGSEFLIGENMTVSQIPCLKCDKKICLRCRKICNETGCPCLVDRKILEESSRGSKTVGSLLTDVEVMQNDKPMISIGSKPRGSIKKLLELDRESQCKYLEENPIYDEKLDAVYQPRFKKPNKSDPDFTSGVYIRMVVNGRMEYIPVSTQETVGYFLWLALEMANNSGKYSRIFNYKGAKLVLNGSSLAHNTIISDLKPGKNSMMQILVTHT
jgi:hypothetical protein